MEDELFCVPSKIAHFRLILLHGWGADGRDLLPLGEALIDQLGIEVELIALNAPQNHPQGFGKQWYDLFPPDWAQAKQAIKELKTRLRAFEFSRIPLNKTVLLGFSQGGAMAIHAGVHFPFAGIIGCSSYFHPDFRPPVQSPPIFLMHGRSDNVVPFEASKKLVEMFEKNNSDIEFHAFNGSHEIPQSSYENIVLFLRKYFQKT